MVAQGLVKRIRVENKTATVLSADHDTAIVSVAETMELLGVRYGQRLQHHRINQREDRGVCAYTQGQGNHYDRGECG